MSIPLAPDDPAYWMLEQGLKDPSKRSRSDVYDADCYICTDKEFSLMGLPLCYACPTCGEHIAADDCICKNGHDASTQEADAREASGKNGHAVLTDEES